MKMARFVFVVCMISIGFFSVMRSEGSEPSKPTEAQFYYCSDPAKLCFSDKADACASCGEGLVKKPAALKSCMEVLGEMAKNLKDDIQKASYEIINKRVQISSFITEKATQFKPSKATEDTAGFKTLLTNLHTASQDLGKAAEKKDAASLKSGFDKYSATCAECHKKFR
jgi:cytochrome c556